METVGISQQVASFGIFSVVVAEHSVLLGNDAELMRKWNSMGRKFQPYCKEIP